MKSTRRLAIVVSLLGCVTLGRNSPAQTWPVQYQTVAYNHDTGLASNTGDQRAVVISFPVLVCEAQWLRLYFDSIELGDAVLRVTSYRDGDVQELHARQCLEWQNSTCYFNGDAVQVEVEAPPHSGPYQLVLSRVDAGQQPVFPESQCGPTDDRVLSNDPRIGRMMPPPQCTAWLIEDCNRCLLTAGHCFAMPPSPTVVQFNVPLSDATGSMQMPSPDDQYAIDVVSVQSSSLGILDDWAYFGVFANPNTNLAAGFAQGSQFTLASPPAGTGYNVLVAGYGLDTTPLPYNGVQQTHSGALVGNAGSVLDYEVDTEGGNSGSPIVDVASGNAIGIHAYGFCQTTVPIGQNSGTASTHIPLQAALKNPLGVCDVPKLLANDVTGGEFFGYSVAIDGDTAIAGARYDDDAGPASGSAYVFVRNGAGWTQQAKLVATDAAAFDIFGQSVALCGDTAVVGAMDDADLGTKSGSAYVFVRIGSTWAQQAKLLASDGAAFNFFGTTVSVSGETAIVGAPYHDGAASESGAAYVFVRSGGAWTQQVELSASDAQAIDHFGSSVAICGDTAVVGAPIDDDNGSNSGSAYVFVRTGTTWTQQTKLLASDGGAGDEFGFSVAINGDSAIFGALGDGDNGVQSGAAYVFTRTGTTWTELTKLHADDGQASDNFGSAVAISGGVAIVGAPFDDDNGIDAGAAYEFVRSGGSWTQRAKLLATDGNTGDRLGGSASASGDTALVGADHFPTATGPITGATYVCGVANTYASVYCTAKINSAGCLPALRWSGTPSLTVASPFNVIATSIINNKNGRFLYSTAGPNSATFQGGKLCVLQPLRRTPIQNSFGDVSGSDCSGVLTLDFNNWLDTGNDFAITAGTKVYIQAWYRDPTSSWGTGLTNGVEFEVLP